MKKGDTARIIKSRPTDTGWIVILSIIDSLGKETEKTLSFDSKEEAQDYFASNVRKKEKH